MVGKKGKKSQVAASPTFSRADLLQGPLPAHCSHPLSHREFLVEAFSPELWDFRLLRVTNDGEYGIQEPLNSVSENPSLLL